MGAFWRRSHNPCHNAASRALHFPLAYESTVFGLQPTDSVALTPDQRTAIELQITLSIIDESSWLYRNFKPPRFRNSYGFAQLMSGAYVVQTIQLQYINQEILATNTDTFTINDNVDCNTRAILDTLSPGTVLAVRVLLFRSRITSIRFRLYSGVRANLGIRWITAESDCGNAIATPDERQGKPLPPANSGGDAGGRPSNQGGDPEDPSANDGNYDPTGDLPPPPKPGGGSNFPCWHAAFVVSYPPACTAAPFTLDFPEASDEFIFPNYAIDGNSACPGTTNGRIMYGGAILNEPDDVISVTFSYY